MSKSKQPVFAIERAKALEIAEVLLQEDPPYERGHNYAWGNIDSADEFLGHIRDLPETQDLVKISRLSYMLEGLYTHKMPGNANRMLNKFLRLCREQRVVLPAE